MLNKILIGLKSIDQNIRIWLCHKYGHKWSVGLSGYYIGLPQSHCWRCGKSEKDNSYRNPIGGWFN